MIHLAALAISLVSQCSAYDSVDFDRGVIMEEHLPKVWLDRDIPLIVVLDSDLAPLDQTVRAAIDWWNAELGFNVFLYAGMLPVKQGIDINGASPILELSPKYKTDADTKLLPVVGPIGFGMIGVKASLGKNKRRALFLLKHELGHLLGLAHDRDPRSIMTVKGKQKRFVTDRDKSLLKGLYNSESSERKPSEGSDGGQPLDEGATKNRYKGSGDEIRI